MTAPRATTTRPPERYTTFARKGSTLRQEQTAAAVELYVGQGLSIRAVAAALYLSYGKVHVLLVESGAQLRHKGGLRRRRRSNKPPAAAMQPAFDGPGEPA